MKSSKLSFDWMIFASATIIFVFGKFIAPRYEDMLMASGAVEEVTPISKYCIFVSGFLIVCLLGRWYFRWKNRGEE